MSKITQIEPQKSSYAKALERRGIRRFNIFLDGQFAFGADEDLVVKFRLIPGKEIEPPMFDKLLDEAEVGKLMERMYHWFGIRQRSEKEVRDYFRIKNAELRIKEKEPISDLVIDQIIERLKQKGLINDLEFAKAWVEGRRRSKQKGVRALKMELFQKGIDREIIKEVTSGQGQESGEEELAKIALEKKMKSWKKLDPSKLKQKALEYLLRKGFEYEVISLILKDK